MFTGIIEEVGTIHSVRHSSTSYEVKINANKVLEDVKLGDSISVNGICLTVTSFTSTSFTVDVMPETLSSTNLNHLTTNQPVNLERAMAAGGRFGGHFVSGHIDGVGQIVKRAPKHNAIYYKIKVSDELRRFLLVKGSIAVDGTSLTIFEVDKDGFTISLIPHTVQESVIGGKMEGDQVNIECDMLAKYLEQLLVNREHQPVQQSLSKTFLEENGF
ncbi:riboflavin synthase [Pseudalkalibacillus decolorationis]|uniref:riboflavin synthase n=1 Tax=Pseudalkalibacillus decolorationis TaxID=163879 RepID=UPI002148F535|nr:riboflavin synthase [Pseudalkalibacillus decolorationis]